MDKTNGNQFFISCFITLKQITLLLFGVGASYTVIGRGARANRGWSDGRIFSF